MILVLVLFAICLSATAQNIIEDRDAQRTAPAIQITLEQARECIERIPVFCGDAKSSEAQRIHRKLNTHVAQFLDGAPWMPFHHTLGISGHEAYFDHPDELFYTLSIALLYVSEKNAEKAKRFLLEELKDFPPYELNGYDQRNGRPRESYDVPGNLQLPGKGKAKSAFGVYAFWAFCHYAEQADLAKEHWAAVKDRIQPLLNSDYSFDIRKTDYSRDEAERLNGDLAGLIGFARLAQINSDTPRYRHATERVRQLLELRVNLERVNPRILEKTTATKSLHISKLARFCGLTPEVGAVVARWTDDCGAARLKAFREARNGWHLAFGDRMIGGENYTNPLHFPRALFAGAVFVERLPPDELFRFIDVPWCKGDLYFIEKCAYALGAEASGSYSSPTAR